MTFDDIRGLLTGLFINVADQLPVSTRELITEFIEVGEFGLALETIAEMLVVSKARISSDVVDHVTALSERMKLAANVPQQLYGLVEP